MSFENLIYEEMELLEAARFDQTARKVVLRNINRFRFGIEFEFNVTEGANALNEFLPPDEQENPITKKIVAPVKLLSRGIKNIQSYSRTTIQEYADDIEGFIFGTTTIDEVEKEYIQETVLPEAAKIAYEFGVSILKPSQEIVSSYKGDITRGMGIAYSLMGPKGSAKARSIVAAAGLRQSPSIDKRIALVVFEAMSAIVDYLDQDCEFVSPNISEKALNDGIVSVIDADRDGDVMKTKVEIVAAGIPVDSRYIDRVTPDITVPDGVEVITKPLRYEEILDVMDEMFQFIRKVGGTDNSTGMHLNVSIDNGLSLDKIDIVKMMMLMDVDFYQGRSRGSKKFMKFPLRNQFVMPITDFLTSTSNRSGETPVEELARLYKFNGSRNFLDEFSKMVLRDNAKERAINLRHMLHADVSQRRIEFRFFGGADYERRFDEIQNDILFISYVMLVAMDPTFMREEYYRSVIRHLDRAARDVTNDPNVKSFADLIKRVDG